MGWQTSTFSIARTGDGQFQGRPTDVEEPSRWEGWQRPGRPRQSEGSATLRQAVRCHTFSNITPEGNTSIFCSLFFATLLITLRWCIRIKISSSPKRKAAESDSNNAKRSPVLIYVNTPCTENDRVLTAACIVCRSGGWEGHHAYRRLREVRSGLVICLLVLRQ